MNVPPTPNLQNLKLHGQKAKKKPIINTQIPYQGIIKPKQHPKINTPTIYANKSPKIYKNIQTSSGIYYPENKVQNYKEWNSRPPLYEQQDNGEDDCNMNAYEEEREDKSKRIVHYDKERVYKKQKIDEFRQRIQDLKQNMAIIKNICQEELKEDEERFSQNFQYLNQSINNLILQLEQKRKQLSNNLITEIENKKKSFEENLNKLTSIKDSLERYVFDVNKHYEQILQRIQISQFQQIMSVYNTKIDYYNEQTGVNKYLRKNHAGFQKIEVYVPVREIRSAYQKACLKFSNKQNQSINRECKNNSQFKNFNFEVKNSNIFKLQAGHHHTFQLRKNNLKKGYVGMKGYESEKNFGDVKITHLNY